METLLEKEIVLNVKNVTKVYKTRVAVNNVSFSILSGEIFGFLGPNGAGKTTTMKMICGLTSITKGNITINGYDVTKKYEKAMAHVGGLIENPLMYPYLSALDNLKYYATLSPNAKKEDIEKCAEIVGLKDRLKDKVKTYSLGMRQRLGIAQALLSSPNLLVLDEPFSGLDPEGVSDMRRFLKNISHSYNIAILVSSHMLSDMEQICDRIGIINNGQLLEVKTLRELNETVASNKKLKMKVDYPNFAGKILIVDMKLKVELAGDSILIYATERSINSITKKLMDNGINIFGIEVVTKNLEEIFLGLISENKMHATSAN